MKSNGRPGEIELNSLFKASAIDNIDFNDEKVIEPLIDFINTLPYLIMLIGVKKDHHKILLVNEQMARSLGKSVDELLGKNILDYLPPKAKKRRLKYEQKMLNTKKPVFFEDKREQRFFSNEYYPLIDEQDDISYGLIIVRDVTEKNKQIKQKINRKEAYYEGLIENTMDLITVINKKGEILYTSPSMRKILGYTQNERIGKNAFTNIHPNDKTKLKRYLKELISTPNLTKTVTFRIKDKQGTWHHFESFANNQLENKQIKGIIINSRDISTRVKQELEKSAILDNTSEIIAFHDSNHEIIWANKAYQTETGNTLDQLKGKKCYHAWGLDTICERCPITKALESGETHQAIFSPENQKHWPSDFKTWLIKADPVKNEDGKIIGAIELSYDITKEKKADEAIKRAKNHLEKLVNNTSELIFTVDNTYKITLWNQTAENITGMKIKKMIGKDIRKIERFDNSSEIQAFLKKQFNKQPSSINEISINTLFGSKRAFQVSTSLIKDNHQNITDIIFICKDITNRERAYGKLLSGQSYLIEDPTLDMTISLFNSTMSSNRSGLFITRIQYEDVIQQVKKNQATIALLSTTPLPNVNTIHDLKTLEKKISTFVSKHHDNIICITRCDFLFTLFGFEPVLSILYRINDIIRKKQAILLLQINNELLNETQYELLKEEYQLLPSKEIKEIYLDDSLLEMLAHIYEENQSNTRVYQKNLCSQLSISKVTAQKRIDALIEKDLVFSRKQGRIKNLFITDKGKELLHKQMKS